MDEETAKRLKRLSQEWKVSQAEVVRRAVAAADASPELSGVSAAKAFRELHRSGRGLVREEADRYLDEVREDRKRWRSG